MDADGLQDETPPLDRFHAKDSSSLSEYAPSGLHPTVVPSFLSHHLTRMAGMAQFLSNWSRTDESDDSSDDSVRLLSQMSHQSLSSISLASSVISSDSDYHSCLDEMPTELEQSNELLSDGSELEEPVAWISLL